MSSQGPNNPGTMSQAAYGSITWSNLDEAKSSNNLYAENAGYTSSDNTYYLQATNFGFSIPSGATIGGIEVVVEKRRENLSGPTIADNVMKLIKGGSIVGNNATAVNWQTSDTPATYGGSTSLWGTTWTAEEINASNFGFAFAVALTTSKGSHIHGYVDHIKITVTYAGSSSPSISPSASPSISPSVSPSRSPSVSPSKSPSVSPSRSPSVSPSKSPSISPSASPSMAVPLGSVVWGHSTGATEDNKKTIASDWTGTGTISGSGDDEEVCLDDGEYMISDIIETGDMYSILTQNKYVAGDDATIFYKTGATRADCSADSWKQYTSSFLSSNFVQMKMVNPTWWLAGGISASNCVAAYQAKGVTSLSESYVNLANPGTYNLTLGADAISWSASNGWEFNKTNLDYFKTGLTPSNGWSAIVCFANASASNGAVFGCQLTTGTEQRFLIYPSFSGGLYVRYGYGAGTSVSPIATSGTLAITLDGGYRNGVDEANCSTITDAMPKILIGTQSYCTSGLETPGGATWFDGYLYAIAFYTTSISAAQVAALHTAMSAL